VALAGPTMRCRRLGAAPAGDDAQVDLRLAQPHAIAADAHVHDMASSTAAAQADAVEWPRSPACWSLDLIERIVPDSINGLGAIKILAFEDLAKGADVRARHKGQLSAAVMTYHLTLGSAFSGGRLPH